MESFEDSKGERQTLSLTIGKARRQVKALTGLDFIDGDPTEITNDLILKRSIQLDLVWILLDGKGESDDAQEVFEDTRLDGPAFDKARVALIAEITNFIRAVRPEYQEVFAEAILLIQSEVMQSAKRAASLLQSKEVKEGFLQASANAEEKARKEISRQFSRLQEDSE